MKMKTTEHKRKQTKTNENKNEHDILYIFFSVLNTKKEYNR